MEPSQERIGGAELQSHAASLRRLAQGILGDAALAEDVVQDAWVLALERPPGIRGALRPWLTTVARHLALNLRRARERRGAHELAQAERKEVESPLDLQARLESQRLLLVTFQQLREPYRTALYLRYWEGLAPPEIAARLQLPLETIKSRLTRGLALLRARYGAQAEDRPELGLALLTLARPAEHSLAPLLAASATHFTAIPYLAGALMLKTSTKALVVLAALCLAWQMRGLWLEPMGFHSRALPAAISSTELGPQLREELPLLEAGELPESERQAILAETPTPSTGKLMVQVRWWDGRPAAGIALEVHCRENPTPRPERFHLVTDAAGAALFPAVFAGQILLFSDRNTRHEIDLIAGTEHEHVLVLPRGETLVGWVEDSAGNPVAGAELWLDEYSAWQDAYRATQSAADGSFRLENLGPRARIGVRAQGFAPSPLYDLGESGIARTGQGTRELRIVLPEDEVGWVKGIVLDADQRPLAGARVKIGAPGNGGIDLKDGLRAQTPPPLAVTTEEDGSFQYPGGLAVGEQPVYAIADGWPQWSGSTTVRAGQVSELTIVLELPATIVGQVRDEALQPVSGVTVTASEEWSYGHHHGVFPACQAETDATGSFVLRWVAPGERSLCALDAKRPWLGQAQGRVLCPAGSSVVVNLQLDLGAQIRGRVVDGAGRALPAWSVWANPTGYFGERAQASTEADGSFVLANLSEETTYEVTVRAPGEFSVRSRASAKRVRTGVYDLQLEVEDTTNATARLVGQVAGTTTLVPLECQLTLWEEGGTAGHFVEFDKKTGQFDSGPLLAGRYRLSLLRGGQTLLQTPIVELAQGEVRDVGLLAFEDGGVIELSISGPPTEALGDLHISVERPGFGSEDLTLDGTLLSTRRLAPGPWTLKCWRGGGWFLREELIEVPAGGLLSLKREAQRAVKVPINCLLSDAEAAWESFTYEVLDDAGDLVLRSDEVRAEKWGWRLSGLALPAGEYELRAWTDSGLKGSLRLLVPAGVSCAPEQDLELH